MNRQDLIKELEKYCHSRICDKPFECPSFHPECKERLDLDTAIAWYVRKLLIAEGEKLLLLRQCKSVIDVVEVSLEVVTVHYKKYPELVRLLQNVLRYLRSTIDDTWIEEEISCPLKGKLFAIGSWLFAKVKLHKIPSLYVSGGYLTTGKSSLGSRMIGTSLPFELDGERCSAPVRAHTADVGRILYPFPKRSKTARIPKGFMGVSFSPLDVTYVGEKEISVTCFTIPNPKSVAHLLSPSSMKRYQKIFKQLWRGAKRNESV